MGFHCGELASRVDVDGVLRGRSRCGHEFAVLFEDCLQGCRLRNAEPFKPSKQFG